MIGIAQNPDIDEILDEAKRFLEKGKTILITKQHFSGIRTKEHPYEFEYELYVDMGK